MGLHMLSEAHAKGLGYCKLPQNLEQKHKQEAIAVRERCMLSQQIVWSSLLYSERVQNFERWIQYVTGCLQSLVVVGNLNHCDHLRHRWITLNTFHKYLYLLTDCVETNVYSVLPSRFALVFDSQSTLDAHYVMGFASLFFSKAAGFITFCLALSPMEDETAQSGLKHITFLKVVLGVFGK